MKKFMKKFEEIEDVFALAIVSLCLGIMIGAVIGSMIISADFIYIAAIDVPIILAITLLRLCFWTFKEMLPDEEVEED